MSRSQNCLHPPSLPSSPLSFSALSVNSVLRKARSLTHIDPPAPLHFPCHSPIIAIPFRITSFAHPHHLTPIESHSCKKQGSGWGIKSPSPTQPLPLFPTAARLRARSATCNSNRFICLLHGSLDTPGVGSASNKSPQSPLPLFARSQYARPSTNHAMDTGSGLLRPFQLSTVDCQLFKYNPGAPFRSPLHHGGPFHSGG
jgi:hypothetical protein